MFNFECQSNDIYGIQMIQKTNVGEKRLPAHHPLIAIQLAWKKKIYRDHKMRSNFKLVSLQSSRSIRIWSYSSNSVSLVISSRCRRCTTLLTICMMFVFNLKSSVVKLLMICCVSSDNGSRTLFRLDLHGPITSSPSPDGAGLFFAFSVMGTKLNRCQNRIESRTI